MKIFDGRYAWDGKKHDEHDPIAWFPGAYDLKIVVFPDGEKGKLRRLKPYLCVYARTGEGLSISANPEKFAREICRRFDLDIEKVLWVEDLLGGEDRYEVVTFRKSGHLAEEPLYSFGKRPATAAEVEMIEREMAELARWKEPAVEQQDG
jgi:hypothetical protein